MGEINLCKIDLNLMDIEPIFMAQTNPLSNMQFLEGTMKGKECDDIEEGTSNITNRKEVNKKFENVENLGQGKGERSHDGTMTFDCTSLAIDNGDRGK